MFSSKHGCVSSKRGTVMSFVPLIISNKNDDWSYKRFHPAFVEGGRESQKKIFCFKVCVDRIGVMAS